MDNTSNSKKEINFNTKDVLSIILFLVAFLIIWQIVFSLEIWPRVSLPSPAMVADSFVDLVSCRDGHAAKDHHLSPTNSRPDERLADDPRDGAR